MALAGFVFICTALTYAELSSAFPESGGSATFSRKAFNDFISFIAGWGLLLDYIVTIAISAFAIAPYLIYSIQDISHSSSLDTAWHIGSTLFFIFLLFVINFYGTRDKVYF